MRQTITHESGRFTIRNPVTPLRAKAAEHPMGLFAALAGAAMMAFALAPQASAFAEEGAPQLVMAELAQPATAESRTASVCADQAWGQESEACLVELARNAGAPRAKIRIIELQ